jgi:Outer membrane protein beta-barrel domain
MWANAPLFGRRLGGGAFLCVCNLLARQTSTLLILRTVSRFLLTAAFGLLSFLPLSTFGQVHGGVKAGLNLATLDGTLNRRSEVRPTVHGGLYLTAWIGKHIAIQPEVLYSEQGMKFGLTPTAAADNKLKMQVIDIPLLLKLYPGGQHFYFEVGPQFGLLVGATQELVSNGGAQALSTEIKKDYKNSDYAVVAGLGVEAGRLLIGVRGIYGLSDLNNNPAEAAIRAAQDLGGLHHRVLQVSAGIRIF